MLHAFILTSKGLECESNGVEPNKSWFVVTLPLRRGIDAFGGGATVIGYSKKRKLEFIAAAVVDSFRIFAMIEIQRNTNTMAWF